MHSPLQGGHGTGKTGKTGNLVLTFSRQGKHRELCSDTGKNLLTQGKYLDCDYQHKKYVYFFKFQKFLASLRSAYAFNFTVLCYISSHMLCVPILPVYVLSVSEYSCIIFISDMKQTDVGRGVILK